jgi:hypothetical protein
LRKLRVEPLRGSGWEKEADLLELGDGRGDWVGGVYGIRSTVGRWNPGRVSWVYIHGAEGDPSYGYVWRGGKGSGRRKHQRGKGARLVNRKEEMTLELFGNCANGKYRQR